MMIVALFTLCLLGNYLCNPMPIDTLLYLDKTTNATTVTESKQDLAALTWLYLAIRSLDKHNIMLFSNTNQRYPYIVSLPTGQPQPNK